MIGVFDSGSGGLTVLKEIRKKSPKLDILYFGDLKHMPYGSRSKEELGALTMHNLSMLRERGAGGLVSACNSVSESVLKTCTEAISKEGFVVVEMTRPTVKALQEEKGELMVVATPATVESKIYEQSFQKVGKQIHSLALPNLVHSIEQNDYQAIRESIRVGVSRILEVRPSIILLGCTQFPLVQKVFEEVFLESRIKCTIVNPASFVAEEVVSRFGQAGTGKLEFLISKDSDYFRNLVHDMFEEVSEITVV